MAPRARRPVIPWNEARWILVAWGRYCLSIGACLLITASGWAQQDRVAAHFAEMKRAAEELLARSEAAIGALGVTEARALAKRNLALMFGAGELLEGLGLSIGEERQYRAKNGFDDAFEKSWQARLSLLEERLRQVLSDSERNALEKELEAAVGSQAGAEATSNKRIAIESAIGATLALQSMIEDLWRAKSRPPEAMELGAALANAQESLRKGVAAATMSYEPGAIVIAFDAGIAAGGKLTLSGVREGVNIRFRCAANAPLRRFAPERCEVEGAGVPASDRAEKRADVLHRRTPDFATHRLMTRDIKGLVELAGRPHRAP